MVTATHERAGDRMSLSTILPLHARTDLGPFVYYIQCGMFVKIGTSIDPYNRRKQLESGNGGKAQRPDIWVDEVILLASEIGSVYHERQRHEQFAHLRHRGEWFYLTEELADFIEAVQFSGAMKAVELSRDIFTGLPIPVDQQSAPMLEALGDYPSIDREWIDEVDRWYPHLYTQEKAS